MRVLHYEPAIRLELGGVVRAVLDIAAENKHKAGSQRHPGHPRRKDVPSDFPWKVLVIPGPGILGRLGSGTAKAASLCQQNRRGSSSRHVVSGQSAVG